MSSNFVIVGSGLSSGVLIKHLLNHRNVPKIIVVDDTFSSKTNHGDKFEDEYFRNTYSNEFGGTSNLWHGVTTHFTDKENSYFEKLTKKNVNNIFFKEFELVSDILNFEHGEASAFFSSEDIAEGCQSFFSGDKIGLHRYWVSKKPFRSAVFIKKMIRIGRIQIVRAKLERLEPMSDEIKLHLIDRNGTKTILSSSNVTLSMGALNTFRVLKTSKLLNDELAPKLTDHPIVFVGELRSKMPIRTSYYGNGSFFGSQQRLGFVIENESFGSHGVFIRPKLGVEDTAFRETLREVLFNHKSFLKSPKNALTIFRNFPKFIRLLNEKIGICYPTKLFDVTFNLDLNGLDAFEFIENKFTFRRDVVEDLVDNILTNFGDGIVDTCEFYPADFPLILPGAHFSGTLPLGLNQDNPVNLNYTLRSDERIKIFDAGILPYSGHINLSGILACLAIDFGHFHA